MAKSPAHRFGQIIGELLESAIYPFLQNFAAEHGYYLDRSGSRSARSGKKVTWSDNYGNTHDLDFVIELDGTEDEIGRPIAFIEAAWRRYTKHSRNKAQEIQGALLPIAEKYTWERPFLGAVIGGVFTESALEQMRSVGFEVLYFPYSSILAAFSRFGIQVEFDEDTPDSEFKRCVEEIEALTPAGLEKVRAVLIELNKSAVSKFLESLKAALGRRIQKVVVLPLFGDRVRFSTAQEASLFIERFNPSEASKSKFVRFEIIIEYTNGDEIRGSFEGQSEAREFLALVANR